MFDKYTINPGDTLNSIADRFNTKPDILMDINNLYFPDEFRVGMDIIVPKNAEQYFNYYTIETGDSLYKIAKKYNINPTLLASLNGLNMEDYIYPNQELLIPKSGYSYYITAEGDTLSGVSSAFKTTPENMLKYNNTIYLLPEQILVYKSRS